MPLTCPMPANINPLRLTGYNFNISKLPELSFFVQNVEIPQITLGVTSQYTSVHDIKIPGETMEYAPLTIEFLVDENMTNWRGIYSWIIALGYPTGHELYKAYISKQPGFSELSKGYSDGFLAVLDNSNIAIQTFTFVDLFPVSLSGMRYDSSAQEPEVARASVTFEYSYYTMS